MWCTTNHLREISSFCVAFSICTRHEGRAGLPRLCGDKISCERSARPRKNRLCQKQGGGGWRGSTHPSVFIPRKKATYQKLTRDSQAQPDATFRITTPRIKKLEEKFSFCCGLIFSPLCTKRGSYAPCFPDLRLSVPAAGFDALCAIPSASCGAQQQQHQTPGRGRKTFSFWFRVIMGERVGFSTRKHTHTLFTYRSGNKFCRSNATIFFFFFSRQLLVHGLREEEERRELRE